MFLGYFKRLETFMFEPRNYFQKTEMCFLRYELKYEKSRPEIINALVGKKAKTLDLSEDIIADNFEVFEIAFTSLYMYGKCMITVKFACRDDTILFVYGENFVHPSNKRLGVAFLHPLFKIPTHCWNTHKDTITDSCLQFVTSLQPSLQHP